MSYFNGLIDNIVRASPNAQLTNQRVQPQDITVCIAIRISEITPWILDRLEFTLNYYTPQPKFLIVDLGSEPEYAEKIEAVCKQNPNTTYLYVDDKGTFALAKARNIAGRATETPFIFFSDIDFVYERNIFQRLSELADDLEMNQSIRRMLFMPIYHVNKEATAEFESLNFEDKQRFIQGMGYFGQHTAFKGLFEFVAPYANTFLIHKDFFDLSGGYCDKFRGHGSEDFEYLIRLGILSTNAPLPDMLGKDFYGPLKDSFFGVRDYAGFRRYIEVLAAPGESLGLKAFHMWHEKPSTQGYWTAQNDWKRERFNEAFSSFYPEIHNILNSDYHPRSKKALCVFSDKKSWGYFLPLRQFNYKLQAFTASDDQSLADILFALENKEFDRVFIFNPYMKSHAKYRGIIEIAKKHNIEVTVIERGGLPNSIYYAPEVVYGDPEYKNLDSILASYKIKTPETSQHLINTLKTGNEFLEHQEAYETTWKKHTLIRNSNYTTVFIPLQLDDDMAVTQFTHGYTSYNNFYQEINNVVKNNPNVFFLIKRHPLSKEHLNIECDNVKIIEQNDNVHALIDMCDATIVYNSGVGLLSVIHNKPTFNIGNSYYTSPTKFANQVISIQDALDQLQNKNYHISDETDILTLIDWLMNQKYSWFTASSVIREFQNRRAHGYDNIMVERITLDSVSKNCGARYDKYPFSAKSYLGWKTMLNQSRNTSSSTSKPIADSKPEKKIEHNQDVVKQAKTENNLKVNLAAKPQSLVKLTPDSLHKRLLTSLFVAVLSKKKAENLRKNPQAFFDDSNSKFIKCLKGFYVK